MYHKLKWKTIKHERENIGGNVYDPAVGWEFWNRTAKACSIQENIDELASINIKNVCSASNIVKRMKKKKKWKKKS